MFRVYAMIHARPIHPTGNFCRVLINYVPSYSFLYFIVMIPTKPSVCKILVKKFNFKFNHEQ